MKTPPETEFRFDLVLPGQRFACLVWESLRLALHEGATQDEITQRGNLSIALNLEAFPPPKDTPWLAISPPLQRQAADIWPEHEASLQTGYDSLALFAPFKGQPAPAGWQRPSSRTHVREGSPDWWRAHFENIGCVVFDLGQKGLFQKSELVARFQAWVEENPDWVRSDGHHLQSANPRVYLLDDRLRRLAWHRLHTLAKAPEFQNTTYSPSGTALEWISTFPVFAEWLQLPDRETARSKWKMDALDVASIIVKIDLENRFPEPPGEEGKSSVV
jgi:hypothetical protein